MPLPLKAGYNFNYAHIRRPPRFEMAAAEAYTDFYGLSYLISGETLSYSPEGVSVQKSGDISFIPRNVYFRSSYVSDTPREGILIKFTDSMVSDLLTVMGVDSFDDLLTDQETIIHLGKNTQEKVLHILNEMEQEWNAYNKYSEIILKGLLHRLIITCLKERTKKDMLSVPGSRKQQDCLANAIEYVTSHLSESPSLHDTARHIHISASYLSKLFISQLYTPYSTFILNEKYCMHKGFL